jgi:hypothetical protein
MSRGFPFPCCPFLLAVLAFRLPPSKRGNCLLPPPASTALRDVFVLVFELVALPIAELTAGAISATGTSHTAVRILGYPLYSATSAADQTTIFSPLSGSVYGGFYQLDEAPVFYPCQILFKGWEPCS